MAEDLEGSLFDLSRIYAGAADRREVQAFVSAFLADAELIICHATEPERATRTLRGHSELAEIPRALAKYSKTFHLLGQATYELDDRIATGEVYCIAHHLSAYADAWENRVITSDTPTNTGPSTMHPGRSRSDAFRLTGQRPAR